MSGGREQFGKRQCWSRVDEGFPDSCGGEPSEAADVEDFGLSVEDGGDDLGVAGQSAQGRGGELFPGLGGAEPGELLEVRKRHGQGESRDGAMGLGQQVGALEPSAALDQGVEQPGAVVAGVAAVVAAPRDVAGGRVAHRSGGGLGCGEGDQGGFHEGGVLGGAAAFDPGAAALVVGDGEVPVEVGGAFEAVQLALGVPVLTVWVDQGRGVGG